MMVYLAVTPERLKGIQLRRSAPPKVSIEPEGRSVLLDSVISVTDANISPNAKFTDIFDDIINSVFTIVNSRNQGTTSAGLNDKKGLMRWLMTMKRLTDDDLNSVTSVKTSQDIIVPSTPSSAAKLLGTGGHTPMPRNPRQISGSASVKTVQSAAKLKGNLQEAKDKIMKESKKPYYDLVYMRLMKLVCLSSADLHGDKLSSDTDLHFAPPGALMSYLFDHFDKNKDGIVSLEELAAIFKEVNLSLSPQEIEVFVNRFDDVSYNGLKGLSCRAFCKFYELHTKSFGVSNGSAPNERSLVSLLILVKRNVKAALDAKHKVGFDLDPSATLTRPLPSTADGSSHFDNSFFTTLDASMVSKNAKTLRRINVDISDDEMKRISYVFNYDVKQFMRFINSGIDPSEIIRELELVTRKMFEGMVAKGCKSSQIMKKAGYCIDAQSGEDVHALKDVLKLWNTFVHDSSHLTSYENLCNFFSDLVAEALRDPAAAASSPSKSSAASSTAMSDGARSSAPELEKSEKSVADVAKTDEASPATSETPAIAKVEEPDKPAKPVPDATASVPEVRRENFVLDPNVLCRICADEILASKWNKYSVSEKLISLGAFQAFVASDLIDAIESKLIYLMMLEKEVKANSKTFLIHIYLNSQRSKFVVLAREPISGEYFRLDCDDINVAKLMDLEDLRHKRFAYDVYTPTETPHEDAAMQSIVNRLRFVKTPENLKSSQLIIAEDKKLVDTLQSILDSANLPYFFTLNDLCLNFEVDAATAQAKGGVKKVVFSLLRSKKELAKILCSISCSLLVVISSYNGHERECLDWSEMVAHLTDYRNPFVSVQLLPDFLKPEDYIYAPYEKKDPEDHASNDGIVSVQRGKADYDGGSFPGWDSPLIFEYKPPKLTSCKVVNSTIARIQIDGVMTFSVVFSREGRRGEKKDRFLFLTLYDPRSATEYQCGVQLSKDLLAPTGNPNDSSKYDEHFAEYVDRAVKMGLLLIGPIITPHIVITAYNEKPKNEEILGYSQMSISSVLSGHGNTQPRWLKLMYTASETGKMIPAGDISVEISFKRKKDIDNEKESKLAVKSAQQARAKARREGESTAPSVASTPRGGTASGGAAIKSTDEPLSKLKAELDTKKAEIDLISNEKKKLQMQLEALSKSAAVQQAAPVDKHEKDDTELLKLASELESLKKKQRDLEEENRSLKAAKPVTLPVTAAATVTEVKSANAALKGDTFSDIISDLKRIFTVRNNTSGKSLQPGQFLRLLKTFTVTYPDDDVISQNDLVECLGSFVIEISASQLKVKKIL